MIKKQNKKTRVIWDIRGNVTICARTCQLDDNLMSNRDGETRRSWPLLWHKLFPLPFTSFKPRFKQYHRERVTQVLNSYLKGCAVTNLSVLFLIFWIRNPKSKWNEVEEILVNLLFSCWLVVVGTINSNSTLSAWWQFDVKAWWETRRSRWKDKF